MIKDIDDLNEKMGLLYRGDDWIPLVDDKDRLLEIILELSRYFASGNSVTVKSANIKTEDFCRITGLNVKDLTNEG